MTTPPGHIPGIVEIIGPPGVGKSTIYRELCKTWHPNDSWMPQDMLLSLERPHLSDFANWLKFQAMQLTGKRKAKHYPVEFGLKFADTYHGLANFCWEHLSNPAVYNTSAIAKRFRSAHFLFSDFCKYQAIHEHNAGKTIIVNEGLLQKSFFINLNEQFIKEIICKYLTLIPLPAAIVYINVTDSHIIRDRLISRDKIIASHLNMNDEELVLDVKRWQHVLDAIVGAARARNILVYTVDGTRTVSDNALRIKHLLRSLKQV